MTICAYRGEQDLRAIVDLYNSAAQLDGKELGTSEEEMHWRLADPGLLPEQHAFLFEMNGLLVAFGFAVLERGSEESVFDFYGTVHPRWRRHGIGTRVIERIEESVHQRLAEAETQTVYINIHTNLKCAGRQILFEKMGYEPMRYFFDMECPLHEDGAPIHIAAPQVPDGLIIKTMAERCDLPRVRNAADEAFRDHWGHVETTLEQWLHWTSDPDYNPERWLVAWDLGRDDVAGVCLSSTSPRQNERVGRAEGWIFALAVQRPYRRRGLGRALLLNTLRTLQRDGLTWAMLTVDGENATGALHIYENVGFRVVRRHAAMRKLLRS